MAPRPPGTVLLAPGLLVLAGLRLLDALTLVAMGIIVALTRGLAPRRRPPILDLADAWASVPTWQLGVLAGLGLLAAGLLGAGAVGVWRQARWARGVVLVWAALAVVAWPILGVLATDPLGAVLGVAPAAGALVLLHGPWRRWGRP